MRQQFLDVARGMVLHAGQHVGEVVDGVDAMLFAGRHERVQRGEVMARLLVAEEEVVRATQRRAAQRSFGDVVVERDRSVSQEAAECAKVPEHVAYRTTQRGAWSVSSSMRACPAKQLHEGRLRFSLPQSEVVLGADDARSLGVGFDAIEASDQIERLLRLGMLGQYLDEVLRVLPYWPKERHLELAPKNWKATRAKLRADELAAPLCSFTIPAA